MNDKGEAHNRQQKGQIAIIGLLVMVTVLAIALSVVGRSTSEVATSSKSEESSRALSAAEGGIEKALSALQSSSPGTIFNQTMSFAGSNTTADVNSFSLPASGLALSYPNITKSDFAQFWLADPVSLASSYTQQTFTVFFGLANSGLTDLGLSSNYYSGNPGEKPGLEIRVISYNGTGYESEAYLLDSNNTRIGSNQFKLASCSNGGTTIAVNRLGDSKNFYCKYTVSLSYGHPTGSHYPVMIRARVLYSSLAHPVAIQPASGYSLPQQANIVESTGTIANVQRKIQVFQQKNVLPLFMDFALFSGGVLEK